MADTPSDIGACDLRTTLRVLHMEDDEGSARLLQRRLPQGRYDVDLATDGERGIAMCQARTYDLLLVDHHMPVYNGLEVIRALAAKGALPPTIMITGAGDEKLAAEAMKLGASDYVVKDPDGGYLELVPSVMERALATHRLEEERKHSEEALREREELLRLITDALPACISYADTAQRYVFANKTYEQWFSRPSADMIGHHFAEIWGSSAYLKAQMHLQAVLQGKTTRHEDELTFHDGVTRCISATHVPHFGEGNMVKGYVSLISDITERTRHVEELRKAREELERRVQQRTAELATSLDKLRLEVQERTRAETELRASEERFRAIFETAVDCIFVKDHSLRYTQVNPAMERLLGIPASEFVGKTGSSFFEPEFSRQIEEVDHRVLDGEFVEQTNTRWVGKNLITFHDIRVPLRDTSGAITGLCGISRDVTGLKAPEPEMQGTHNEYCAPAMKETVAKALLAAETDTMVLLLGESGSGKDYLARYIHDNSKRSAGPFFAVNCAAVAAELAESELFGHESGAFTGAGGRKRGLLELAEGGTLLLNEIGELTPALQTKLLAFLDTRSFTRVGGETNIRVNARLIAATNCDLSREVSEGRFRIDLFYRLNVFSITLPPLRERLEDLPLLVRGIIHKLASEMQLHEKPFVDATAMRTLAAYHWPGNVRELRNVIERALILSGGKGSRISPELLGLGGQLPSEWSFTVTLPTGRSVNHVADEVKRALIAETLARSQGNKQAAAGMLGISRYALFRMMKALNMSED